MRDFLTRVTLAILLVAGVASPVQATFHIWNIEEVFSNGDGTIQFVELTSSANFQNFLANHTLTTRMTSSTLQTFTFLSNLPSNQTGGRSFLMATQGFANSQGGVTPDYVIPDGFIDVGQVDEIDFAEGADFFFVGPADEGVIPTNGIDSLNRGQGVLVATPTNFAGETGSVPEPSQGLLAFVAIGTLAGLARVWKPRARVESQRIRWIVSLPRR